MSSNLSSEQLDHLINMLQDHKKAIVWTVEDLVGVPPSYCTHRIYMEEGHMAFYDSQRRLNPIMKEVVYKEVVKWLDASIVYSFSDSEWVRPLHMVPKKGGMTVVENDKRGANSIEDHYWKASLHGLLQAQRCYKEGPFPTTLP